MKSWHLIVSIGGIYFLIVEGIVIVTMVFKTTVVVSEDFAGCRSNRKRRGDLLVPKDQHSVIVDFSTGFKVLEERIVIDIDLI